MPQEAQTLDLLEKYFISYIKDVQKAKGNHVQTTKGNNVNNVSPNREYQQTITSSSTKW